MRELEKLRKKAKDYDDLAKKFGGKSPDDINKELEELRRKAQAFDSIQKKFPGMDPSKLLNYIGFFRLIIEGIGGLKKKRKCIRKPIKCFGECKYKWLVTGFQRKGLNFGWFDGRKN